MTGILKRHTVDKQINVFFGILFRIKETTGAYNRFEGIEGFEVAGEDKVFHKATAKHFWQEGNDPWNECVIVTSPEEN